MPAESSSPTSYELEVLTIVNNEGDGFDIRNQFLELNLYEGIQQPFLAGEIVIGDTVGLRENAKLFGQESLRLRFSQPSGSNDETDEADTIDQIFRIYKISNEQRIDENTITYQLQFCSPEFLESRRKRVSQALRGSMTDMAAKIAEDHLGIANETKDAKLEPYFELREKSQGDSFHVVVPNWTVISTINHLCKEAQGTDSSSGFTDSFFFYQTANGGYRIQSLTSMMDQEYAGGRPFVYSQAASDNPDKETPYDSTKESTGMGRRILDFKVSQAADVLSGTYGGLFASRQVTVDNTYQFFVDKSFDFLEEFHGSKRSSHCHPFVRQEPEVLHIGTSAEKGDVEIIGTREGEKIGTYADAFITMENDSSFKYDEDNKITQPAHKIHMGPEQKRRAALQLLEYNTVELVLSCRTDISVGQIIQLDIPPAVPGEDVEPKFFNGPHLLTKIMWRLTPNSCELHATAIKDSVNNQIETVEIEYGGTE